MFAVLAFISERLAELQRSEEAALLPPDLTVMPEG
jgi:hypothetical protein